MESFKVPFGHNFDCFSQDRVYFIGQWIWLTHILANSTASFSLVVNLSFFFSHHLLLLMPSEGLACDENKQNYDVCVQSAIKSNNMVAVTSSCQTTQWYLIGLGGPTAIVVFVQVFKCKSLRMCSGMFYSC